MSSARDLLTPLIEAATRRSDEVPATGPAKLEVHPQQAVSIRCKLREYLSLLIAASQAVDLIVGEVRKLTESATVNDFKEKYE